MMQVEYTAPDGMKFIGIAFFDYRGVRPVWRDGAREQYEKYCADILQTC